MRLFYDQKEHREMIFKMYQEIFEDPKPFAQYYFDEVYKNNIVLLAMDQEELKGMIHLNPYKIQIADESQELFYIVAVAVKKECRRQGIMASMLKKCLCDIQGKKQPFTYLMPANRAYYEPFDFVFVMDWKQCVISGEKSRHSVGVIEIAKEKDYPKISSYLQECMQEYGIYTVPNIEYLKRAEKESQSSNGHLMVWKVDEEIKGVFVQGQEENETFLRLSYAKEPEEMLRQIKSLYSGREIEITGGNLTRGNLTPKIMARITSLKAWEKILKGKKNFSFRMIVEDPLIKENDGMFHFQWNGHKMMITKETKDGDQAERITIGDLTRVFFGYQSQPILEQHPNLENIVPAGPVYISEEV